MIWLFLLLSQSMFHILSFGNFRIVSLVFTIRVTFWNDYYRHGYARYVPIVEDRENGIADCASKELNLTIPSVNGSSSANEAQSGDVASSSNVSADISLALESCLVEVYNLRNMFFWFVFLPIICQGNVDASKVNQVGPEYHYHYAQRKMVDFIRKRYQILEKAMNLEYAVVLSFL